MAQYLLPVIPPIGPNNPDSAICLYYPLPSDINIASVSALFTANAGTGVAINLALGVAPLTGTVPVDGSTAVNGDQVWATDQVLSLTPGVNNVFSCPSPNAIWPEGLVLTVRAATGSGGCEGLALVIFDGDESNDDELEFSASSVQFTAVGPTGVPSNDMLIIPTGGTGTITIALLNPPAGAGSITAVSNNPLVQVELTGGGTSPVAEFTVTATPLGGVPYTSYFNTSALITFYVAGDETDSGAGFPVLVYVPLLNIQSGRSAAQAVATVRRRTNLNFGEPSDADIVAMLNDGIEEVSRTFEPVIMSGSLIVTAPNTNMLVLPQDVERIRDANFSTGNPALGGTVQYELVQLDYDSFIQETDSTPAGGIGGIPTIYTLIRDASGLMVVQFYPYCNGGQFNFHYYKRPILYTTITNSTGAVVANPSSYTDLDSLWQGAVLLYACMQACENAEDLATGAAYYKKLYDETMIKNELEVKRRVRKRGTNTVRDVSVGESVVPTWLR